MNLITISDQLNTKEKCIQYLEEKRWNGVPTCPYCGSKKSSPKKFRHTCLNCSNSYSVMVGTVFESTKLPLYKWFMAISIILSAKKGVSSMQLSRELSVNKNTAWLLQMKIRAALDDHILDAFFPRGPVMRINKFRRRKFSPNSTQKNFFAINGINSIGFNGFWNQLKHAIIGQYHQIDVFYFHRYVDEVRFKCSVLKDKDRGYERLLKRMLFETVAPI